MDLVSGNSRFGESNSSATGGRKLVHEQKRPAVRSSRLAAGTLACGQCDAPIAIGPEPVSVVDQLVCPYCRHRGLVRDFLSLALPTRPARVVVRVSYGPIAARRT
jgi:DNA-directed RNA polymerase subunit RPC12/RpoP